MNVYSLEEAKEWFLENSSGGVECVSGDAMQWCDTYIEAVRFYKIY